MDGNPSPDFIPGTPQNQFIPNASVENELSTSSPSSSFLTASQMQNVSSQTMQLGLPSTLGSHEMSLSPHSTFHLDLHPSSSLNASDPQQLPMLWFSAGSFRPSQAATLQGILNLTPLTQEILPCRQLSMDSTQGGSNSLVQDVLPSSTADSLVHVSASSNYAPLRTIVSVNDSLQGNGLCVDNSGSISVNTVISPSLLNPQVEDLPNSGLISQSDMTTCISNVDPVASIHSIYSIAPSQIASTDLTASVNSSRNNLSILEDGLQHDANDLQVPVACSLHSSVQDINISQITIPPELLSSGVANDISMQNNHLEVEVVYRNSNHNVCNGSEMPLMQAVNNIRADSKDSPLLCLPSANAVLSYGKQEMHEDLNNALAAVSENSKSMDIIDVKNLDGLVEVVECYKCKLCPFICLNKKSVQCHVQNEHVKNCALQKVYCGNVNSRADEIDEVEVNSAEGCEGSDPPIALSMDNCKELPLQAKDSEMKVMMHSTARGDRFICSKCQKWFSSFTACQAHMVEAHHLKKDKMRIEKLNSAEESPLAEVKTPVTTRAKGRSKRASVVLKENMMREKLLRTRRKQKLPRKMHSLDESSDEESVGKKDCNDPHEETTKASMSPSKDSDASEDDNEGREDTKTTGTGKKRGRPKGSKNTGITAMKRKNPKVKIEEELGYKCEVDNCAIRMKSIDNLEYHRRCHISEAYGFTCPECHEKFDHWRSISVHLWRSHVIDMELYACDLCSYKTYSFSKLVNMHKRIHSEERPFLCDTCGKGFKTSKQLRNHKVIHLDKRRQRSFRSGECDICHRFFSDKRMLRVHKDTVHNKLRPFLCNYCGYAASCRSTLKMHMRQHTGEKPFSCDMCAYRTADHNSLRRHKMRHSGEKPYKCPFCSYACIQSSTYKTHLKNKHPGQDEGLMYSCNLCSFRTIKKDNYVTHMADHKAGTIPIKTEWAIQEDPEKQEMVSVRPDEGLLVQTQSVANLATLDNMNGNMTAAQVMFSTLDDFKNKIAIAAQGYPLEMNSTDRYPILGGLLKHHHLDSSVSLDPSTHISIQDGHQAFLVHEPIQQEVGLTDNIISHHDPRLREQ